jgi:uncharacterized protein (UPF0332 family)
MAYPEDLLEDAKSAIAATGKRPRQSQLRRAVSTAYYSAFHLLVADFVANWRLPEQRARLGRMFEHRRMSGPALEYGDKSRPTPAEQDLKQLIAKFTQLQKDRHEADYNVGKIWSRTDAKRTIDLADEIFTTWRRIRKRKSAQHHLLSMFGARQS